MGDFSTGASRARKGDARRGANGACDGDDAPMPAVILYGPSPWTRAREDEGARERSTRRRRTSSHAASTAHARRRGESAGNHARMEFSKRARRAVFHAVARDADALAACARIAVGTCDPVSTFARARRALGVSVDGTTSAQSRDCGAFFAPTSTSFALAPACGVRVRYQGDWLDIAGASTGTHARHYLDRWIAAPFEPYSGAVKNIAYAVATPFRRPGEDFERGCARVMREISREYAACALGAHEPIIANDDAALFSPPASSDATTTETHMERYASALSLAARALADVASRAPATCALYVVIPDDMDEIDACAALALASHVVGAAMRSIDGCLLSISIQALPHSWCGADGWSPARVKNVAFNVFLKAMRPTVTRKIPLNDDGMDMPPRSATDVTRTDGRAGVTGASVVGRRRPHPCFQILETSTTPSAGAELPSFPTYEPLYVLRDEDDDDNNALTTTDYGLHCAYVIVADRWVVAAWSDARGEFLTVEAEPFASRDDVRTRGIAWLVHRTSTLAEQLEFTYGEASSAESRFKRVVMCALGAPSRAGASEAWLGAPLGTLERALRVEMTCFEPDSAPASVVTTASVAASGGDMAVVIASDDASGSVKAYATPPAGEWSRRVACGADVSSVHLRLMKSHEDEKTSGEDMEALRGVATLYASRLSQLGMMCASEVVVDEASGRLRAPLPLHAHACVNFASFIQIIEANGV